MKPVEWAGDSRDSMRSFPATVRQELGYQLRRVQDGLDPIDWKRMASIGASVREIRVRDAAGAFRVVYVAKFSTAIFVLHAFQKKTQRTSKRDIDLAAERFKQIAKGQRK